VQLSSRANSAIIKTMKRGTTAAPQVIDSGCSGLQDVSASKIDMDLTLNLLRQKADAEIRAACPVSAGGSKKTNFFTDSPVQQQPTKLFGSQTMQHYASIENLPNLSFGQFLQHEQAADPQAESQLPQLSLEAKPFNCSQGQ
jgi:hypothetical protein